MAIEKGSLVLVRDDKAGVHVGTLVALSAEAVTLSNARKVWYWTGAASVHGIAVRGLSQAGSKVAPMVSEVISFHVCEVVEMTNEGYASVMECPEWTP
jgi:hypothetical protein